MKRTLTARGAVTLVAAAGVTVMLSGVSYAYWSVTGSGTGTAGATTAQALTVTTATSASGLHPGASVTGTLTIGNPNPFPVEVSELTFTPATASGVSSCVTTGVTFSSAVSSDNRVAVPAGSSSHVTYTATMTNASEDGCQGATFTSTVTATGSS
jgi:hypothetical protein